MNISFKKVIFSLFLISVFFSCQDDDNSPNEKRDIITEEGNISIAALRDVNPNFSIENLAENGSSAVELLTDNQFKSITLEIVSVEGFAPSNFAKQTLLDFIEARLHKPNGVRIIEKSIPSPNIDNYSIQTVFGEIEAKNRTQFNTDSDLAIFVFFADEDNEDSSFDENMSSIVLGTAYLNTSLVIYKKTLMTLTQNNLSDLQRIEAGTLTHEFCHLLGLVNGPETPDIEDHESEEIDDDGNIAGNNHCNVLGCLMESEARFVRDMMGSLEVLQLDPLCIQDLQAIGGK